MSQMGKQYWKAVALAAVKLVRGTTGVRLRTIGLDDCMLQ